MKEIKCIDDIRNGDLVVTRDKKRYIKIDKYLIGKEGHLCISDYQIEDGLILDKDKCEHFDIIEIWSPVDVLEFLSFDLGDRELVWKEQEQKYYIKHRWSETEFTLLEIEELKEKYNTILEDFEIIPVKEI